MRQSFLVILLCCLGPVLLLSIVAVVAIYSTGKQGPRPYPFPLPRGFPEPRVPDDNPITQKKADLGRYLFYDRHLSGNETFSCGSCHKQELAFTDGRAQAIGSTGEKTSRSVMSLSAPGYVSVLTWANPLVATLEQQAMTPMFGQHPTEMGLAGKEDLLLSRLREEPRYQTLFPAAFPGEADPFSVGNVVRAIASFERTMISGRSPYDRYQHGEDGALSDSARRGLDLFFGERCECYHCHGTFLLSDSMTAARTTADESAHHNTGLYNIGGTGAYPPDNQGRFEFTRSPGDMGAFRAPSLRNIEKTAPYMHDGSIATLEEVIDHYARGGRKIDTGPYAGDGSKSRYKSNFLAGFSLSQVEKQDLIAFLRSLTDEEFLHDPKLSDPFPPTPRTVRPRVRGSRPRRHEGGSPAGWR